MNKCDADQYRSLLDGDDQTALDEFESNNPNCTKSFLKMTEDSGPKIEVVWYDQEIVLNDDLLERTPLNPTDAENTYQIKSKRKSYGFEFHSASLGTATKFRLKYKTNYLEKYLLSTGTTTKESYGTLSFESMEQS
jgi:hypothetical protein